MIHEVYEVRLPAVGLHLELVGLGELGIVLFEFGVDATYLFYLSDDVDALMEKLRKIDFDRVL